MTDEEAQGIVDNWIDRTGCDGRDGAEPGNDDLIDLVRSGEQYAMDRFRAIRSAVLAAKDRR
jgi:hypothetical protein